MLFYIIAFLAGFLVKAVDWIEDEKKGRGRGKYLLALLYGLMLGYLLSFAPFSLLFLATLIAQLFAGKIDRPSHELGAAVATITLLFFGFPTLQFLPFTFFFILAFADELRLPQPFAVLTKYRLFLKIGAALFILIGRWEYFAGILAFDIGYTLFSYFVTKL